MRSNELNTPVFPSFGNSLLYKSTPHVKSHFLVPCECKINIFFFHSVPRQHREDVGFLLICYSPISAVTNVAVKVSSLAIIRDWISLLTEEVTGLLKQFRNKNSPVSFGLFVMRSKMTNVGILVGTSTSGNFLKVVYCVKVWFPVLFDFPRNKKIPFFSYS